MTHFITPSSANRNDDYNEGWIVGGRVDFYPFGALKFSQGDFSGKQKATIGIAAFNWSNDGDNYQESWNRTELGANYFFHKHDIKTQLTYRMDESLKGVDDKDEDEVYLQMQYVF